MRDIKITKSEKNSWEYIKTYYKLDFLQPGQIVIQNNNYGVVIGAENSYLLIHFTNGNTGNYHPTSNITYLNIKGDIIKDYRINKK